MAKDGKAEHALILSPDDKLRSPEDYDKVVCAEVPDPDTEKELFDVVSTCMMHGPCGERYPNAPCMVHGSCSKHYPREYCDETYESADAYPVYRRRNDGRKVTVRHAVLDNRYVVPYNRALALRYRCHINVEVCATVRSVKYLHKYVYKGPDRAAVQLQAPAAAAPEPHPSQVGSSMLQVELNPLSVMKSAHFLMDATFPHPSAVGGCYSMTSIANLRMSSN